MNKKYLVAYKTGPICTDSAIIEMPYSYKPSDDEDLLTLKEAVINTVKPSYELGIASSDGIVPWSLRQMTVNELTILSISRLDV